MNSGGVAASNITSRVSQPLCHPSQLRDSSGLIIPELPLNLSVSALIFLTPSLLAYFSISYMSNSPSAIRYTYVMSPLTTPERKLWLQNQLTNRRNYIYKSTIYAGKLDCDKRATGSSSTTMPRPSRRPRD